MQCEICDRALQPWDIGRGCSLWRCGACGHLQRDLDLCFAEARAHAWGGDALFDKIRTGLTFRRMRSLFLRGRDKLDVFEIGFGSGNLLRRFLDGGHGAGGVEKGLLERDIPAEVSGRARLSFGEAEAVDFPAGKDLVYAIHLIEHVRDPNLVARKAFAALKPGGRVFFITPNGDSAGLRLFRSHWWNLEDPTHIRFFSEKSAADLLRNAGFKDVEVSIPIWDSLTLETNSLMRYARAGSAGGVRSRTGGAGAGNHGVLDSVFTKAVDAGLLPLALLARLAWPRIAPSIEIRGRK